MKVLTTVILAELGWLFLATTGPTWAYLVAAAGFVLTPAFAIGASSHPFARLLVAILVTAGLVGIGAAMVAVAGTHPWAVVVLAWVGLMIIGWVGGGIK